MLFGRKRKRTEHERDDSRSIVPGFTDESVFEEDAAPQGVEFRDRSGMWYPAARVEKLAGLSPEGYVQWAAYPPDGYRLPRSQWWMRRTVNACRVERLPAQSCLRVVFPIPGTAFRAADFLHIDPLSETT